MEKSEASQKLLRYLAERALRGDTPKETEIAIDVFGRDASFNSAEESLVRVAVRALRRRLHDYYAGPGQHDEVQFDIPKGGYRLTCVPREVAQAQPRRRRVQPRTHPLPESPCGRACGRQAAEQMDPDMGPGSHRPAGPCR